MKFTHFLLTFALCGWVGSLAQVAQAQVSDAPTFHRSYRFLSSQSVLNESGGFFPRDVDYQVFGTFDLVTGWDDRESWPGQSAKFENVDAWASHPLADMIINLDDALNLSGLKGEQLPVLAPFDVYRFDGKTENESSVRLFARILTPWIYLNGETTPPPGGADMLQYKLDAVARQFPYADFDDSGVVDADDLSEWESAFGASAPNALTLPPVGDANGDQMVDGADFLSWQRQLGETPPPHPAPEGGAAAVPEPGAMALAVVGALFFLGRVRRGR